MDVTAGGATVSVDDPVKPLELAKIVVPPCERLLATPAALTVGPAVADELQETTFVRSCVEPVLYLPVAKNGCDVPNGIEALAGVTEIETNWIGIPFPDSLTFRVPSCESVITE